MVDTALIKIVILCLNLIFYSPEAPHGQTDMLQSGSYKGTFSSVVKGKVMTVLFKTGKKSIKMMTVTTIDNGLYSVKFKNEDPFKIDLAKYFIKIDWKKLKNGGSLKVEDISLSSSRKNIYVQYGKQTFIIDKGLLDKKRKSIKSKSEILKNKFRAACEAGDTKKMSETVKKLATKNIIRKGITSQEVEKVLGTPVHFTGIYIPGGLSWGYGKEKSTATNNDKFYWIHLKPENERNDSSLLHSWD